MRIASTAGGATALALLVSTLLASCSQKRSDDTETFFIAVQSGQHEAALRLLSEKRVDPNVVAPNGVTALIVASGLGDQGMVNLLISNGANIDLRHGALGFTALMAAAEAGRRDIAVLLLDKGADPNAAANDGQTPLMVAAYKGNGDIVQALLSAGASANHAALDGRTALMGAAQEGHTDVVRVILHAGADVNAMTRDGWSALSVAERRGQRDVVAVLRGAAQQGRPAGAGQPSRSESGRTDMQQ